MLAARHESGPWLLLLFVAGGAGCQPPPPQEASRPNVLLVSIDTLRADHLSCYGYERPTSPTLDRVAAEGVLFERTLSSSSWTLPAHLTMLTGLPTSAHGVCDDRLWTRKDESGAPIAPPLRGTFVAEALGGAGYRTAGFYTWKYLEEQFGFGPGFEVWQRLGHTFYSHPEVGPAFERLRAANDVEGMKALAERHPELFDDSRPSSPETIDRALEWLSQLGQDDPFFLFVHLFDVHDPYLPPAPYDTLFDADYDGPIDGRRITAPDSPVRADMPKRDLEHLVALYDGGIAWVDAEVGRLLDGLAHMGLEEDTLVIITSDHGEEFFEHGHKTHRRQVHMESVHVPLILRWPAGLPPGRRVAEWTGLTDVAPTIYAAAGLSAPPVAAGTDLLAVARGEHRDSKRTYLSELLLFDGGTVPERRAALARGERLVLRRSRGPAVLETAVFELDSNPAGEGPGRAPSPDEKADVEQRLDRVRRAIATLRASLAPRDADLPPLSEHDRRQLAALGYAGLEEGAAGSADTSDRLCLDGCVWPQAD